MPLTTITLVLASPVAAVVATQTEAQSPDLQVRAAIASMNNAAARLDADLFMAWYWNSPALAITFDGQTMRGWRAILDQQRKWWKDKASGVKFAEERPAELSVQASGVVTSVQWMTVTGGPSGAKPSRLTITSIWKKLPEGWRIVLAHESLTD